MTTSPAPNRAAVSEMDEARLTKLLDEAAAADAKAVEAKAQLTAFCRAWSVENGRIPYLTAEHLQREFAMRKRGPSHAVL